jgi:hypothetical protein
MYIIDAEYSQYEAALTSERQKFGFASAVVQQGLTTAGVLVTPVATTKILSGLAGAVGATKGFYDSEIIIAKTIQIAQGQMRAQRDIAAKRILLRRGEPITTYPLSAALSDLEEYYRAGTLNSGLIKAAEDAGVAASTAAADRTFLIQGTFSPDNATRRLRAYAVPGGVPNAARIEILNDCLVALGYPPTAGAYMTSSSAAGVRMLMIQCALGKTSRFDFGSAREKEGSHADDENRGSTYCNQGTSD